MLKKQSKKEKEKIVSKDGNEAGRDSPNLDSDIRINNKKEKSAQEPEKENLDLVMENDDWAASAASSFSLYEKNEGLDSANSWDQC